MFRHLIDENTMVTTGFFTCWISLPHGCAPTAQAGDGMMQIFM